MTQDLYIQLKTVFKHYDFDDQANFYKLFRFAKRAGVRGLSFKQFAQHAKNMGVYSQVQRRDQSVARVLKYDAKADTYIKKVFPKFEDCPTCKGVGLVEITF